MKNNQTEIGKEKTFRAHIWSPLNNGEAILEIDIGTTVEELLETLTKLWGAQFKPERGFAYHKGAIAGWCVLCKSTGGVYCPLGMEDPIPNEPIDDKEGVFRRHDYSLSWFRQTYPKAMYARNDRGNSSVKLEDIAEVYKKGAVRGIIHADLGVIEPELQVFLSGPEPKEDVDVSLAVIIAVSGT